MDPIGDKKITVFRPRDLSVIDGVKQYLTEDGGISIPENVKGFVVYGPYRPFRTGFYEVSVDVSVKDNRVVGAFDLFNNGHTIALVPLKKDTRFKIWIENATMLEVRVQAEGAPFHLKSVKLEHLSDERPASTVGDGWVETQDEAIVSKFAAENLWLALHKPPERKVAAALSLQATEPLLDEWLKKRSPAEIVLAWNDDVLARSTERLQDFNLDPLAIKRCAQDTFQIEANLADALGRFDVAARLRTSEVGQAPFVDNFLRQIAARDAAWQYTAAEQGLVFCVCPMTGVPLESAHSFVVAVEEHRQSYIFVRFESLQTFYLVFAGWGGRKTFIYMPMMNVAIQIGAPSHDWGSQVMPIQKFQNLLLRNADMAFDYLAGSTRIAVVAGILNNLGHYIWNELSGISNFRDEGRLNKVEALLIYKHAFLDPAFLFERDRPIEIHRAATPEAMFQTALRQRMFAVRPTALRVEPKLTQQLQRNAIAKLTGEDVSTIKQALGYDVLIWFNLRSHNKVWVEQAQAVAVIARRITAQGRSVAFFLDGTPDCRDFADQIRDSLPRDVGLFDGLKLTMTQSVVWAFACDLYVATIGSGLTVVTWVSAKSGVAHSERAHLGQLGFWKEVRLNIPAPNAPNRADISDVGSGAYCNYSIDPEVIAKLLDDDIRLCLENDFRHANFERELDAGRRAPMQHVE